MDIYLLKLVGNWISVLVVSLASFFGFDDYKEEASSVENTSYTKTVSVVNKIIPYETEYVYNANKLTTAKKEVLVAGVDGLSYTYENGETKVLNEPVTEVIEVGTKKATEYIGRLTTYSGDCYGCSKTATVACKTKKGKRWSLWKNGIYYPDDEYGDVRIIAADLGGFPCGTMILIDNGRIDPFLAVVMDTGGTMRQQYAQGKIWMDLAFKYKGDSKGTKTGSKNTKFTVLRWGW